MKYTPHILGAVAMVAIAGALSGATIGESRMLAGGQGDNLPETQLVTASNQAMRDAKSLPDHYPLKTPEGTIEVAELALHGRLRDRGGDMRWQDRNNEPDRAGDSYDFYETASPERIAHEEALLAFTGGKADGQDRIRDTEPAEHTRLSRAEAPMALAEPTEITTNDRDVVELSEANIGKSKTIDVTAALAQNN